MQIGCGREIVCSQPMLPQIAGRLSQYSDSLLNTQSEHRLPAPMLLLVIIPRFILLNGLLSHVMCQSFQRVCVFLPLKDCCCRCVGIQNLCCRFLPLTRPAGKITAFTMILQCSQLPAGSNPRSPENPQNSSVFLGGVLV